MTVLLNTLQPRFVARLMILLTMVSALLIPQITPAAEPAASETATEPVRVLIVAGYEYDGDTIRESTAVLKDILVSAGMETTVSEDINILSSTDLQNYQAVVLNFKNFKPSADDTKLLTNLRQYVTSGGGVSVVHFAIGAFENRPEDFQSIIGRVWDPKLRGHDPWGKFMLQYVPMEKSQMEKRHPIAQGLENFVITDELYTCTVGSEEYEVVAAGVSKVDRKVYPLAYVYRLGKGRVFTNLLGHNREAFNNPGYQKLFLRGTMFAAGMIPDSIASDTADVQYSERNTLSQKTMDTLEYVPVLPGEKESLDAAAKMEQARIDVLKTELPDGIGTGAELVGYMNCGSYTTSTFGPVRITVEPTAKTWDFLAESQSQVSQSGKTLASVTSNLQIDTTVFYKIGSLEFMFSGLDRTKKYRLCLKWWDYDAGFRSQGIYLSTPDNRLIRRSVDPISIPNFTRSGHGADVKSIAVPSSYIKDGALKLKIPQSSGPNAVVSELWIYQLP